MIVKFSKKIDQIKLLCNINFLFIIHKNDKYCTDLSIDLQFLSCIITNIVDICNINNIKIANTVHYVKHHTCLLSIYSSKTLIIKTSKNIQRKIYLIMKDKISSKITKTIKFDSGT